MTDFQDTFQYKTTFKPIPVVFSSEDDVKTNVCRLYHLRSKVIRNVKKCSTNHYLLDDVKSKLNTIESEPKLERLATLEPKKAVKLLLSKSKLRFYLIVDPYKEGDIEEVDMKDVWATAQINRFRKQLK